MKKENQIVLKQAPEISHQLSKIGAEVDAKIKELNLDKLVANEDTVKSLKQTRAELNKDLKEYEEQRKTIKAAVNAPFIEFENLYKIEISDKFNAAVETLKDKIAAFENKVKDEKKANVETYFKELCIASKIDFLTFENVGLEINLSTTEKKYKEQCNEFVTRVVDDLALIASMENEAAILTEYKTTLNASAAITTVNARVEQQKVEAEAIRQRDIVNRKYEITALGCGFDEFSKTYQYDDKLFISLKDVEDLEKEEFTTKFQALKAGIAATKKEAEQTGAPLPTGEKPYGVAFVAEAPKQEAAPLSAPTVVEEENQVMAEFRVTTTMPKLKALGQYMRDNGIIYKSI